MHVSDIRFDEAELDRAILEADVHTDLPLEGCRVVAAYSLIAFSMAIAISDDQQYHAALNDLGDIPVDGASRQFMCEFGRVLATDLEQELSEQSPAVPVFLRRANALIESVSALCH